MPIPAFFSLISAATVAILGSYVFARAPRRPVNRLFWLLCLSMSFWAFTEYQLKSSETAERAAFWLTVLCAWPMTIGLLLHFTLVFTEKKRWLGRKSTYALVYLPAVAFMILLSVTTDHVPVHFYWGWQEAAQTDSLKLFEIILSRFWAMFCSFLSLALCARFYLKAQSKYRKKTAKYVLVGISIPVTFGTITEVLLPLFSIRTMEMTTASSSIMCVFIAYAMWRYELFEFNPATAAENILSTMADPLFLVDSNYIIQTTNHAATTLLGYTTEELVGFPISKLFIRNTGDKITGETSFRNVLSSGSVNDVETAFQTKSGRRVPVSLSWSTTKNKDDKVLGITFIARDITERIHFQESLQKSRNDLETMVEEQTRELKISNKMLREEIAERMAAEERLGEEKEHLAVTLRSIGDGVITTDRNGRVALLNKMAEDLTGWTNDEAVGRPLTEVFHIVDGRTRRRCEDPVYAVMQTGEVVSLSQNILLIGKDGAERVVADSGAPIRDQTGKIQGIVLVFRDISEKKKLEEELFKARKLESIAVLADGIAHDFNNILTGIMTNLFVARMQVPSDSETHDLLSETEKAAFRASTLTKQLMTFSKGAAPIKEKTSLGGIIEDSAGFCLSESAVDYELDLADDLDDVEVDRGLIDQALNQIVMNAEQAMPNGGLIRIKVYNMSVDQQHGLPLKSGAYVVVAISDNGPGISESIVHRVFDPYFTTKPNHNGLGLTTAYSVIRKHDGFIEITSQKGQGTTVAVYLPACVKNQEADTENKMHLWSGKGKILLMDDEEYILKSTGKLLNHLGYETIAVRNSDTAIAAFKDAYRENQPFDIAILDLTIPAGMGGKETLERLRQIDPDIKAILSSGYIDDPVMVGYKSYGFCGALSKPYEAEELDTTLENILNENRNAQIDNSAG